MVEVTEKQFEWVGDHKVRHLPTGATFSAQPGRPEVNIVNPGQAGDVLANGDDFELDDIQAVAARLLANRLR